jgi:hypothetical protein
VVGAALVATRALISGDAMRRSIQSLAIFDELF